MIECVNWTYQNNNRNFSAPECYQLAGGTSITYFRKRNVVCREFHRMECSLCVGFDRDGLVKAQIEHEPSEYGLFIDSSRYSSNTVLLHNGMKKPPTPLAFSASMKGTHANMETILNAIKDKQFN
ncbi:hypothetical protein AVEN_221222-1 [Araneus ventricosus]|uniref:Uncharacterized protein n=1 Tax=Araneus ventricosus TaxID=182803 RepID=A0A4Y2ACN7_ARAVE|nr:hypothetical protein AVEN_236514-1 [Araneus ventricosus]GBL77595.1 hypothetical protein AVEN_221222-1 [Araneus ventricosus]